MFHIEREQPLPSKCRAHYRGLAFDGCHFYLTAPCSGEIVQLDCDFCELRRLEGCYDCLCYDSCERCFWATRDCSPAMLFKLNDVLEEIGCLAVSVPGICVGVLSGVSYNCCLDALFVACEGGIVRVSKDCSPDSLVQAWRGEWALGIVSICPYLLCYHASAKGKTISLYSDCGAVVAEAVVPEEFCLEGAVFVPGGKGGDQFCALITRHGRYSSLLCCKLCVPGVQLCACNLRVNCPKPGSHEPCTDLLESIALMEASLAHILNAEGEKLQKAIASSCDVQELLTINASVQKTMDKAAFLEHLLCDKLEAVAACCCEKGPHCA